MAVGCPCGAHVRSTYEDVTELSDDLITTVISNSTWYKKYAWLFLVWLGQKIAPYLICSSPREDMPEFELSDWVSQPVGAFKIGQALRTALYPLLCECDACPPVTDCGQNENSLLITPEMGQANDPDEPRVKYFQIPTGDMYISHGGTCLGLSNGITVQWYLEYAGPGQYGVNIRNGSDTAPGTSFTGLSLAVTEVTIYWGAAPGPEDKPIPAPPPTIQEYPGPPDCSPADICTALDYVYRTVNEIKFLVQVVAGPLYGATASYLFNLPGVNPIQGALVDALPRVFEALAPVQPSQLVSPEVTPITESSLVELDGAAYAVVELTAVPAPMGYRGVDETQVYWTTAGKAGPGYLVIVGQDGILDFRDLRFGAGLELVIPATATAIAFNLAPGVEVSLTTWGRQV